jgi:hypothetical protein
VPCIVTNKHVIDGAVTSRIAMTLSNGEGAPSLGQYEWITISHFQRKWIHHPAPHVDLAILPIGPYITDAQNRGKQFHYVPIHRSAVATDELLRDLSWMEDIVMIGYPNGIWDSKHNLPVIRKGITATHPRLLYNGKPEFMIDAACFPVSSTTLPSKRVGFLIMALWRHIHEFRNSSRNGLACRSPRMATTISGSF